MEKLENSKLLLSSTSGTPGNTSTEEAEKNESFVAAMTNKILDNHQLRIKNVHVRYENKISVPGHPFLIGLTLAERSAVSTDENFGTSSIVGSNAGIHKSTLLDALATCYHVYICFIFTTDAKSFLDFTQEINLLLKTRHEHCGHLPLPQLSMKFINEPTSGHGIVFVSKEMIANFTLAYFKRRNLAHLEDLEKRLTYQ
ncbi:hypothetical protein O181_123227 [Austropuccinia psidii MF-1]|uniref:Uncharacterized protein n=1 Tax=Austropuccinia psidii MF-1 TaxID=1389203 RepID=A0A9Q3KMA7_9BASI|nr:hypothetical protein [Austropuccinia psidii MF-1]